MGRPPNEIVRRYVRVLLDVAEESSEDLDRLGEELDQVVAALAEHPEVGAALSSPASPRARRAALAESFVRLAEGGALASRFVAVMASRGRGSLLDQVPAAFRAERDERRGVVEAEVTTARRLDPARRERLREALAHRTGREARLRTREDPSILGGLVVRVGNRIYDASAARQLDAFVRDVAARPRRQA